MPAARMTVREIDAGSGVPTTMATTEREINVGNSVTTTPMTCFTPLLRRKR